MVKIIKPKSAATIVITKKKQKKTLCSYGEKT